MRKSKVPLAGALALLAAAIASAATIGINRPAPDFTAKDITGKTQSLRQYRGKTVVLEWNDPKCSYNRKHYVSGNLPSLQKQARAEGVVWLVINSSAREHEGNLNDADLSHWMKEVHWTADAYIRDLPGEIGRRFRATATPGMYVIDGRGVVVYMGALDSIASQNPADIPKATNYVKQALEEIKAGKPVSVRATRPYGCTIKYAS